MRPVSINFLSVRRSTRRTRVSAALLVLALGLGAWAVHRWAAKPDVEPSGILAAYEEAARAAAASAAAAPAIATPASGAEQVRSPSIPLRDALRAVEALRQPGVRVITMVFDIDGTARVDVEIPSLGDVEKCIEMMNAAQSGLVWALSSAQASGSTQTTMLASLGARIAKAD